MIRLRNKNIVLAALIAGLLLVGCGGKSASDYNKEGMAYYDSHDYDQAEQYLQKATEMDADNITYIQNYAMILIQQGKQDEAIKLFESTLMDKSTKKAQKNDKYAYRGIGMAYLRGRDYKKAIAYFDQALDIDREHEWDIDIKYYKANATMLLGDIQAALDLYTEIIGEDKENAAAYEERARIYYDLADYEKAMADYKEALKYEDGGFSTYIGLASCSIKTGHEDEAEEALFLASLLDIKSDQDKYYLGVVHYYQQKFDSAKPEMEYALANGIKDAYFYLAEMCLMDEEYDSALDYFKSYTDSTVVESPTVCNDVAVCSIKMQDYEGAYEWIKKGLAYGSSGVLRELSRNEIVCLENLGELVSAREKLADYIAAYPDDEAAAKEYEYLGTRIRN